MANALRSKDLPEHIAYLAVVRKKRRQQAQALSQREDQDLSSKTFAALTPAEKDMLLKTLLLEQGLIAPD